MKKITQEYDVVVCGGGLAGLCAAVAAARLGHKTCLVQDRPVLGGNSSSEVRVTPHGSAAFHAYARETGIISELIVEERAQNHEMLSECGWMNSVWDLVQYDLVQRTPHLTLHLNTSVTAVEMEGGRRLEESPAPTTDRGYLHRAACPPAQRISAVIGRIAAAETELQLKGTYFIDCTGDALVADLAGCEWRMGTEGQEETHEAHAPEKSSRDTMGNSIHFRARDAGRPAPFTPPPWAVTYDDPNFFYKKGRHPGTEYRGGYWWIEIGMPWDTLHQNEDIRRELTKHALGIWDWVKNKNPQTKDLATNYCLDWIGQVPGKRETRRVMGQYMITEHDIQGNVQFPDEVAFGGWFIDLHSPGGLLAEASEKVVVEGFAAKSVQKSFVGPYGIPLRSLIAKDVDNLFMAGRNLSATHAALGTIRVMLTTALLGQAVGTAAAQALRIKRDPGDFTPEDVVAVQQQLLRDGVFLPHVENRDPADLARSAQATASSEDTEKGTGPDDPAYHEGLSHWRHPSVPANRDELTARRGQWIAVNAGRIETIEVCLTNFSKVPQTVAISLMPTNSIWDYRIKSGKAFADGKLTVPPGEKHWIKWNVGVDIPSDGFVRLDMEKNPEVAWPVARRIVPGHVAAFDTGNDLYRLYGFSKGMTLAYRITPAQSCYQASNVLSGVTRPLRSTNLWRSATGAALPQWLQLEWPQPTKIGTVELTFPGHLIREWNAYGPFYRDPQTPRDYTIEAWDGGKWETVHRETGNYQPHRIHPLAKAVSASKLRVVVTATNGDPSAAIYEIRCYA